VSLTKSFRPLLAIAALVVALSTLAAGAAFAAPADLDPSFAQNGRRTLDSEIARALALQPDGKILVAGDAAGGTPNSEDGAVHRLDPAGSLDPSFATGGARRVISGGRLGGAYALALQPDRKILVAGYEQNSNNDDGMVIRLDANGSTDDGFGQGGVVLDSGGGERVYALALQPDGKILVAGEAYSASSGDVVVYRLSPSGALDAGFGQGGTLRIDSGTAESAYTLAVQPDGKILVAGYVSDSENQDAVVYRLDANGTLDSTFGQSGRRRIDDGGDEAAVALALQPDGRILAAGQTVVNGAGDAVVYRLDAHGALDPTFGQGGTRDIDEGGNNVAYAVALQPDGKILVAGGADGNGNIDATVHRLNGDGSRDQGFGRDGVLRIDDGGGEVADAIVVQPDGRIVIAGTSIIGLSEKATVYRLQGGEPVAVAPGSSTSPATEPTTSPTAVTSPTSATSQTRAPALGSLRITPSAFRAASKGASARPAARPDGALVSFKLDRAASVRFTIERTGNGRRVGGRCVKGTLSNRARPRCTRFTRLAGGFTRSSVAGNNRFRLTGRLGARRLRIAGYRLVATPTADGQRGDARRAPFRVKR
jgi:uncharacterized delta-60 repeat protein